MSASRRLLVLAALLSGAALDAGAAEAASVVYAKGGNVWVANPDGSGERQITADGSASAPWESPSQADDGTILAQRGTRLQRFSRGGSVLGGFEAPLASLPNLREVGPFSPVLSPDGRTIAYYFDTQERSQDAAGNEIWRSLGLQVGYVAAADGASRGRSSFTGENLFDPAWIDDGRVLIFNPYTVFAATPQLLTASVGAEPQAWYADPSTDPTGFAGLPLADGELSRAGDRLAVVRGENTSASSGTPQIRVYAASGTGAPPTPRCDLPIGAKPVIDLTWSADGSQLAWSQPDGVWSTPVAASGDCGLAPRLIVPGGGEPDLGPADVGSADAGGDDGGGGSATGPAATQLRVQRRGRLRYRLGFRLARAGSVTVQVQRRSGRRYRTVRRLRLGNRSAGVQSVNLPRLRRGSHRVVIAVAEAGGATTRSTRTFRAR